MTTEERKYWDELNKMYDLNLECPKSIELDFKEVQFEVAMGYSIDNAIQNNLEVK